MLCNMYQSFDLSECFVHIQHRENVMISDNSSQPPSKRVKFSSGKNGQSMHHNQVSYPSHACKH